ncbi:MAG: RNA 2',3'-cyclic phosphodiesterase, partial [Candidatus Dormiibacterota bacterium]
PRLNQLAALDLGVTPVRADGLHLTLRFLGEVAPEREVAVRRVAAGVAAETVAFSIELQGLGSFATANQPQVLWMGLGAGEGELARLALQLGSGLSEEGWPPERRPFHAHCSLARMPAPLAAGSRAALAELCDQGRGDPPLRMEVRHLALLESVAVPGGPNRYPLRASWPLRER